MSTGNLDRIVDGIRGVTLKKFLICSQFKKHSVKHFNLIRIDYRGTHFNKITYSYRKTF